MAVSSFCPIPAFSQEILESQGLRFRLIPGGSWLSQARDLRAAARQAASPRYADGYIGFRVVRLPNPSP